MAYREDQYLSAHSGVQTRMDRFDPLLVCLHDNISHYKHHKDDKKSYERLVNSVAAMLDANLTNVEKILAADVLISLVEQADSDLRKALSDRLAIRDDLPETLLHYLAYGDIEIAEAVLKYSPLLSDHDLVYITHAKDKDHWCAIAGRAEISDKIISVLSSKNDIDTCLALLSNETITVPDDVLKAMGTIAYQRDDIAQHYIDYRTLPAELAVSIYWHVSVALRTSISRKFKVKDDVLDKALQDCVQDFADRFLDVDDKPSPLMIEVARNYGAMDKISERFMVDVLRRRQGRFFVALYAQLTGLSHQIIIDMMRQKGGQGMAVACRAVGISKEGFISLFLLSRAVLRGVDPVVGAELTMATRYYDGLTYKMAQDILNSSIAK